MDDLTWLQAVLRDSAPCDDICIKIKSSAVNPQNKDEIIFVITSLTGQYAAVQPTLFVVNTANNTTRQLNFKFPISSKDKKIVDCQIINVNYNNTIESVYYQDKLIVIGDCKCSWDTFGSPMSFVGILNLNTLTWENIEKANCENVNYITGKGNEMIGTELSKFFTGDWLFYHHNDCIYIFYFDKKTNYLKKLYAIKLKYCYSAMILMPSNWKFCKIKDENWISILLCGGSNRFGRSFAKYFCLVGVSLKRLEQLKSNVNVLRDECGLYKIFYHDVISTDNLENILNKYKSNNNMFGSGFRGNVNCTYKDFSCTLLLNGYLLLTGGILDGIITDLMICYSLNDNKWFELAKNDGNPQRLIHTLSNHNTLVINKKWMYVVGSELSKSCLRIDLSKMDIAWGKIRLIWIEHLKPTNKDKSLLHRLPTDVLKYVIKFIRY